MSSRFSLTLPLLLLSLAATAAPPEIEHTPPRAEAGKDVVFRASIRASGGVYNPELLWRAAGSSRYRRVPMRAEAVPEWSDKLVIAAAYVLD